MSSEDTSQRIINLTLDEHSIVRRKPEVEHERAVAIFDLLEENSFAPHGAEFIGPYDVQLSLQDDRLVFVIRSQEAVAQGEITLPLKPFRRVVRDYFAICESYFDAIKRLPPSQIEAIDMGRRGLHNEGSEMLRERLDGKITVDFDTARRLFTLICVLHWRG